MITVFVWTVNHEWAFWCRVPLRSLVTLQEIAARSDVECDWLGW